MLGIECDLTMPLWLLCIPCDLGSSEVTQGGSGGSQVVGVEPGPTGGVSEIT